MKPANVELHIEELILHGFAPGDRYHIGAAIERELTQLFSAAGGIPPTLMQSIDVERLDGGAFHVAPGAKTGTIGAQIAQAVYGELHR
jgi:hypothetical protein